MNPSAMSKSVKEVINNKSKRKSLILSSKIIDDLNESKKEIKTDDEDVESRESVDSITSFNTRVNLRARLFNRNKVLVNNILNNEVNKGYSEHSIFSIIQENNIKI